MDNFLSYNKIAIKPLSKSTGLRYGSVVLFLFSALLFGNALGAYNLGNIPIQWLAQFGFITAIVFLCFTRAFYKVPGSKVLLLLFFWSVLVTTFNILFNDYESLMPSLATTPYPVYISLRLLTIISFIATIYLIYWLLVKEYKDTVIKWTVTIGTIVSIFAIYIYIAQIYDLPYFIGNRMGTGGGIQSTTFSYAFHRAMGTFREPSILAEWLVVPFFMSLAYSQKRLNIHSILIGSTILLTGSLTGIVGISSGFIGAILITSPFKLSNLKMLLRFIMIFLLILIVFRVIVIGYETGGTNLFQVISDRLTPIISGGGMKESNRGYVYGYIEDSPLPLFGSGLGNSNILFSKYLGSELVVSFLSLYFNFMFSTGIIGLAILCFFLFHPVVKVWLRRRICWDNQIVWILAAYIAWLIMFTVHSEEFSAMFAAIYALLAYEIRRHSRAGGIKV